MRDLCEAVNACVVFTTSDDWAVLRAKPEPRQRIVICPELPMEAAVKAGKIEMPTVPDETIRQMFEYLPRTFLANERNARAPVRELQPVQNTAPANPYTFTYGSIFAANSLTVSWIVLEWRPTGANMREERRRIEAAIYGGTQEKMRRVKLLQE